jgi:hypothetical protein
MKMRKGAKGGENKESEVLLPYMPVYIKALVGSRECDFTAS